MRPRNEIAAHYFKFTCWWLHQCTITKTTMALDLHKYVLLHSKTEDSLALSSLLATWLKRCIQADRQLTATGCADKNVSLSESEKEPQ